MGVADEVRKMAIPMKGRMMHSKDGELTFQPYGKEGEAIYSVSRGGLNALLMTEAEKHANVSIEFDQKCSSVNLETAEAKFKSYSTGETTKVEGDLLSVQMVLLVPYVLPCKRRIDSLIRSNILSTVIKN